MQDAVKTETRKATSAGLGAGVAGTCLTSPLDSLPAPLAAHRIPGTTAYGMDGWLYTNGALDTAHGTISIADRGGFTLPMVRFYLQLLTFTS